MNIHIYIFEYRLVDTSPYRLVNRRQRDETYQLMTVRYEAFKINVYRSIDLLDPFRNDGCNDKTHLFKDISEYMLARYVGDI